MRADAAHQTLLAATPGSHLDELSELAVRLDIVNEDGRHWATVKTTQTCRLLAAELLAAKGQAKVVRPGDDVRAAIADAMCQVTVRAAGHTTRLHLSGAWWKR